MVPKGRHWNCCAVATYDIAWEHLDLVEWSIGTLQPLLSAAIQDILTSTTMCGMYITTLAWWRLHTTMSKPHSNHLQRTVNFNDILSTG